MKKDLGYNKDSDEWFCIQGNKTKIKKHRKDKSGKQTYKYYFEKETCKNCLQRQDCIKGSTTTRILEVGINTPAFYGYSQQQKTDEFREKYKKRACQEWKNGEMKNFHGLNRARGYGLKSMSTQAKLTVIAVNLKRIASILSSKLNFLSYYFDIWVSSCISSIKTLKNVYFFSGLGQVHCPSLIPQANCIWSKLSLI